MCIVVGCLAILGTKEAEEPLMAELEPESHTGPLHSLPISLVQLTDAVLPMYAEELAALFTGSRAYAEGGVDAMNVTAGFLVVITEGQSTAGC